ncbi:MAG: ATP-dependent Clp protease proteolytic subunit, partial [Gemmatimonadales bacterium]
MRSHAWIVALGALALPAQAQETPRPIYRIDIRGPLLHTLPGMLADALTQAGESDGVVLLVIDSPGGSGPALETSLTILDGATSPVYAIVEGRAWSTAALLALAADSVFLLADATIGGRMGGQTVSPERLAVLRAEFRSRL